ncbi:hypothetical protein [Croceiramulus getboli]|nr:hypothetical protein P8624_08865 [Flavobacteriaceae bacterium YJPT1-3]
MKNYHFSSLLTLVLLVLLTSCSSDDENAIDADLIGTWLLTDTEIINGVGTYSLNQETVTTTTTFDFEENGNVYTVTFTEGGAINEFGGFRGVLTFIPQNGGDASSFEGYSINVGNAGYELFEGTYTVSSNDLLVNREAVSYSADYSINGNSLTVIVDLAAVENEIFQDYDVAVSGQHRLVFEKQE